VTIIHDYFAIVGGGERLVLTLSNHFRKPIITAFINKSLYNNIGWNGTIRPILPYMPGPSQLLRALVAMVTFTAIPRRYVPEAETVLYSGNYAPLARTRLNGRLHLMYCHTPPRFLTDLQALFLQSTPKYLRPLYNFHLRLYKHLYLSALSKINTLIANSQNVSRRIMSFCGRNSVVIYPPCDTDSFRFISQDDYYLSTARLEPHKNVDRVVKAFKKMPQKRLVVVSGGSQYEKIRKLASGSPNIHILGWVSEKKLKELIGRCIATIYVPVNEDFGMSPVESMAAGKPVIGVNSGGLTETVVHGRTGYLMSPHWEETEILDALEYLAPQKALKLRHLCEERAKLFDTSIFIAKMGKILKEDCI